MIMEKKGNKKKTKKVMIYKGYQSSSFEYLGHFIFHYYSYAYITWLADGHDSSSHP